MPRRRRAEVREIAPDPIFGSTLVEKFVNCLMWEGRKAVAQRVFYAAMTKIEEKANGEESLKICGLLHCLISAWSRRWKFWRASSRSALKSAS